MQSETRDMPGKDWLCTTSVSVCTIGNEWCTLLVEKIPIQEQAAAVTVLVWSVLPIIILVSMHAAQHHRAIVSQEIICMRMHEDSCLVVLIDLL